MDELIARVKACVVKNGPRRHKFSCNGTPPTPIITRWEIWLIAALYYPKNLPQVKLIVESFEDDGQQTKKAKESIMHEDLSHQLMEISWCYAELPDLIDQTTKQNFTIRDAKKMIDELHFQEYPLDVRHYIQARLKKNDLNDIF